MYADSVSAAGSAPSTASVSRSRVGAVSNSSSRRSLRRFSHLLPADCTPDAALSARTSAASSSRRPGGASPGHSPRTSPRPSSSTGGASGVAASTCGGASAGGTRPRFFVPLSEEGVLAPWPRVAAPKPPVSNPMRRSSSIPNLLAPDALRRQRELHSTRRPAPVVRKKERSRPVFHDRQGCGVCVAVGRCRQGACWVGHRDYGSARASCGLAYPRIRRRSAQRRALGGTIGSDKDSEPTARGSERDKPIGSTQTRPMHISGSVDARIGRLTGANSRSPAVSSPQAGRRG
ncbi:hypothetical protein ONE63_008336 [Megalurothrips usitatus]|uniref:Uncharacterized protein n=1 Tax=Megalurothrips usitatus TaxID=439358 RepID=A0AAV7XM54_9NEOP|nr:hypothetical protein ONE63_008336 [Megalurothrips usitatus]